MAIVWNEDLAVGIKEIDDQHKELFSRINKLYDSCKQGKGREEVSNILKFLEDYVVSHFNAEEKLQIKHNYPDYTGHKAEHDKFFEYFSDFKQEFDKHGITGAMVIQINKLLVDWLTQHINIVDKAFGDFIKEKI